MPELPEVETTRLSLLPHLKNQQIAKVELRRGGLRFPFPADFAKRIEGQKVTDIRRRAKYLLMDLASGDVLLAHLGMSGSFTVIPKKTAKNYAARTHDHVLFWLKNGVLVAYHDPRRFGIMDVFSKKNEKKHKLLKDIGPEPLDKHFTAAYLTSQLLRRNGPIKPVLMDQKLVVGVGNIYASESLFLSGIHPAAKSRDVVTHSARLISSIRKTLNAALKSGGSTLRNYATADGEMGYFQHHFNVYNREGLPCVACGDLIQKIVQAGRATFFCAQCQKLFSPRIERTKNERRKNTAKRRS